MKWLEKISITIATIIIIAHTIIPHQHKAQIQKIIHECFLAEEKPQSNDSNILLKLSDLIKHINLGEKHLENYRISSYEYNFSPIAIFQIPEIPVFKIQQFAQNKESKQTYYYKFTYVSEERKSCFGLRAPPIT